MLISELPIEQLQNNMEGNTEVIADLTKRLDEIYDILVSLNGFLLRINLYFDYVVSFAVVILLCILYYRVLSYFTR